MQKCRNSGNIDIQFSQQNVEFLTVKYRFVPVILQTFTQRLLDFVRLKIPDTFFCCSLDDSIGQFLQIFTVS